MASSSTSVKKYDVFISFRGPDTRTGFTSFLYNALCDKGIETFLGEDDLARGDEVSPVLLGAIEASKISIIVFSESYAGSRWCLDELNHIVRCKEERGQVVLPVFYRVDPANIRNQLGSYKAEFSRHKRRFKNDPAKLDMWRRSLTTTANLPGLDSATMRSESKLVKEIVEIIREKLQDHISSSDSMKDLIGIENNMQKIESALCIGSKNYDTRVVGICGMGGIGKTTLARVLFEKHSSRFSGSYFLENVSKEVNKQQPLDLQTRVFSELLNEKDLGRVAGFEKDRLSHANVLLVLDNVDHANQLEFLAKDRSWFGPGSRIIVTSRDSQVLRNIAVDEICEVEELSFGDALQLFRSKAFGKEGEESPAEGYMEFTKTMVKKYGKGNPLALTFLGQHFLERSIEEWMELLDSTPNIEVQATLRVVYDGLSEEEKDIFLDIACFFKGKDRNSTQRILGYRYCGVVTGINVLIDCGIVTVNDRGEIWMHDLIQEMGQEIVSQQSNDPGKRSRLWSTPDICHVLEDNRGTKEIEGVLLKCMSPFEITDPLTISPLVFKEMRNLWFLDIDPMDASKLFFTEDLDILPATLRYIRWDYCPLKSLPQSFNPKELCELTIHGSQLQQIWDTKHKDLQNLKALDLNACESLNQHLDLSGASNLEDLNLSSCSSIDKFPLLPNPCNIKCLLMSGTKIEEVTSSVEFLTRVTILCLDSCYMLKTLPTTICKLKSLKILSMRESSKLERFPEILEPMECLEELLLDVTGIKELHPSIENLIGLKTLGLQNCQNLEKLPDTIFNMRSLISVNINGCPNLKCLPKLPFSIKRLDARGCKSLERLSNPWIAFAEDPHVSHVEQEFDFSDCLKLNHGNIVTEFHWRVFARKVVPVSSGAKRLKLSSVPGIGICYPGEKIPSWFDQSEGSSVTVKLLPGWYNTDFKGFAMCALISFNTSSSYPRISLVRESRFTTERGDIVAKSHQPFEMNPISGCDHVVMQFIDADCSDVSGAVQVSFEVFNRETRNGLIDTKSKVINCGVRLLCRQDVEKFHMSNQLGLNAVIDYEVEPISPREELQDHISSSDSMKDLIGIENNMHKIESALRIGSKNEHTRVVGICGMGGIGKTTLARVLFERHSSRFSGSYFLENVNEVNKHLRPSDLQKRVFSELLNGKDLRCVTGFEKARLSRMDVLLILDNVNDAKHLEDLINDRSWLGPGSRIVVITRDLQVLRDTAADEILVVEEMSFDDALRLFLSKAFRKKESPTKEYSELAKIIVTKYGKGNPLALMVLGRFFYTRSIEEWKSEIESLDSTPTQEVQDILRVSYEGMSQNHKDIFLDIACFFKSGDRNSTQTILGYKYLGAVMGLSALIDRALITINDRGEIWMHDLIQEMGQKIVSRQSINPRKRSRLWSTSEICHVLAKNRGTKEVEGVLLKCMSPFEIKNPLTLSPQVFKEMRNLWFLDIDPWDGSKLLFPEDLDFLPASLRYFRWNHCPLKSLPQSFNPKNLCEVAIHGGELERVWNNEYKDLQKLEILDLSFCWSLNQLPDLSRASNLISLNLAGCCNLYQIPELSQNINLNYLNLTDCDNLSQLPDLSRNSNLKDLNLSGCWNLSQVPNLSHNSNLEHLNLSQCRNISQLPDLSCNSNLDYLDLNNCSKLSQLPDLSCSVNLKHLNLSYCSNLSQLPDFSRNSNLESLNLNNCSKLSQLPDLSCNANLKHLNLSYCSNLSQVMDLSHNSNLELLNLSFCSSINKFPMLPNLSNIMYLDLSRTKIEEFPVSIECLIHITRLQLDCCYGIKTLPTTICKLKSLKILSIKESLKLEHFPEILEPMECLEELLLEGTGIRALHPSIKNLTGLKTLSLQNCQNLEKLPETIFNMQSLVSVNINGCPKLKFLPKLLFSIKRLDARRSKSLEKLSNPLFLLGEKLQGTSVEEHLPRHLDAKGCKSVERALKPWITFAEQLQLDRINAVAEFQRRVLAGNSILVSPEPKLRHVREIDIWFPGHEISKWFCYQSEGSSVTVNPGWYNPNFIGFAACAISFHTNPYKDRVSLVWESHFTTEQGEIITKSHRPFDKWIGKDDYAVMQSFHVDCSDISGATQVSFKVAEVIDRFGIKKATQTQVRKCGIRLLYRQDVEEFQRQCQKEKISHFAVAYHV